MKETTIMLVCSAGMSTSLLVSKMKQAAKSQDNPFDIFAIPSNDFDDTLEKKQVDVVLLGPQVRFMKKQFEQKVSNQGIPVGVIDMSDYGMMNGEKVLKQALTLIG